MEYAKGIYRFFDFLRHIFFLFFVLLFYFIGDKVDVKAEL